MPVMIKDTALIKKLARFALATASTLHLDFASIDIVKDKRYKTNKHVFLEKRD